MKLVFLLISAALLTKGFSLSFKDTFLNAHINKFSYTEKYGTWLYIDMEWSDELVTKARNTCIAVRRDTHKDCGEVPYVKGVECTKFTKPSNLMEMFEELANQSANTFYTVNEN